MLARYKRCQPGGPHGGFSPTLCPAAERGARRDRELALQGAAIADPEVRAHTMDLVRPTSRGAADRAEGVWYGVNNYSLGMGLALNRFWLEDMREIRQ